jgi:hypothetical protein
MYSYFASVPTLYALNECGFKFIDVIKTATNKFPVAFLDNVELNAMRDSRHLMRLNEQGSSDMVARVWVDLD